MGQEPTKVPLYLNRTFGSVIMAAAAVAVVFAAVSVLKPTKPQARSDVPVIQTDIIRSA